MLAVHMALYDRDALERGIMSARNNRSYLAFCNSQRLALREFRGLCDGKPQSKPTRTFADHLAELAAKQAPA